MEYIMEILLSAGFGRQDEQARRTPENNQRKQAQQAVVPEFEDMHRLAIDQPRENIAADAHEERYTGVALLEQSEQRVDYIIVPVVAKLFTGRIVMDEVPGKYQK